MVPLEKKTTGPSSGHWKTSSYDVLQDINMLRFAVENIHRFNLDRKKQKQKLDVKLSYFVFTLFLCLPRIIHLNIRTLTCFIPIKLLSVAYNLTAALWRLLTLQFLNN